MFDMGILEIIVILVITLMVVGPERMPEVARKAGQFVRKARNFIASVKDDSDLRDTVRELQQSVDLREEKKSFEHIQQDLFKGFEDVREQINFDELQRPFGNQAPSDEQLKQAQQQHESTDDVKQNEADTVTTETPKDSNHAQTATKPSSNP